MSSMTVQSTGNRRNYLIKGGVIAGLLALLALATALVIGQGSGSGALYSDTNSNANVSVGAGTVTVVLGDDHGTSNGFNLSYGNLAPGVSHTEKFYVKNDGSLNSTAAITGVSNVTGDVSLASYLTYTVNGQPVNLTSGTLSLGNVDAGETRTFVVKIGMVSSAPNSTQGQEFAVHGVHVTLTQR